MFDLSHDCFVVFVRDDTVRFGLPAYSAEEVAATCHSYEEASRVRQGLRDEGKSCIIRSVGHSGGSD